MRTSEAVANGHTLFPNMRRCACETTALKASGANAKLGRGRWTKGPFKGMPLYSLTLEERATCAATCPQRAICYGNNMAFAHRIEANDKLMPSLNDELRTLARKHTNGFSVRLHVLGDFFSLDYVSFWRAMLVNLSALHVYGFTHRRGAIKRALVTLAKEYPSRFIIRHSDTEPNKGVLVANMNDATLPLCPVEMHRVESCLTCGLCPNTQVKGISWRIH